jgi:hypothetical protein
MGKYVPTTVITLGNSGKAVLVFGHMEQSQVYGT